MKTRTILTAALIALTSLAVIQPAQAAECDAWADDECVQSGLPNPRFEYPSLLGEPDLELLDQVLEYLDLGEVQVPLDEVDPEIDACDIGKQDICALLEELINCDGDCVELPEIEAPDVVGIVMEAVDNLCQRQSCDPNDLLPQELIDQVQECLEDEDCIPVPDVVETVTILLAMLLALVGDEVAQLCDKAEDCDVNGLIQVVQETIDEVVTSLCGSSDVKGCDVDDLIPEVCLNKPVDVPLILPGQIQDADGDGIPGIRYTQSTVSTNICETSTNPGPGGTLPAPDPDDGDPNNPIPNPEDLCRQLVTQQSTTFADAALVEDADGDGVPSITVPIYSAGIDGDCQPYLEQTGSFNAGPDPDDNDPSNPINPAYCDTREGQGVTVPSGASQTDADGDGFPVLHLQNTRYVLQSDCTLESQSRPATSVEIDPDDGDSQNPVATEKPVCDDFATTRWLPTGAVQEDNDSDGIPRIGLAEREYRVSSDCTIEATGNQRVNPAFVTGDPDDTDPDNPVPREIEPCQSIDASQLWVPWIPTTRDQDGDGVPVVTLRERLIVQNSDCTVEATTQYRSGAEFGDPDDADPDNPGVSCDGLEMPETKVPTGGVRTKDQDGDGIPQAGYVMESMHLGSDCQVTFSDPETVYQPYPDPDDGDANNPVPFTEPCQDIEVPSFQVVSLGRVSDDDGDRVPLIHTESQTFWLNSDCTVSEGATEPGPSYGDPDDNDMDNPIPTNPQVCQNLESPTVQVYNPPTVEDKDGDQVPWLHFTYDEKSINADCTVAPGPTRDAGGIGDPDDTDPHDPTPDPGAICQDVERECVVEFEQPTGQTRSTDADGDGFPVVEAQFQTYRLSYDPSDPEHAPVAGTETWRTVGGDPDDTNPDNPVPTDPTPCAALSLPPVPLPIGTPVADDQDSDGVPNYKQTFEDHEIQDDCTLQATGELQTIGFGPDPDDQDPDNPVGTLFPCSGLESPFYVPSDFRTDDADGDRIPILVVEEARYTISSSCDVTNTGEVRDSPLGPVGDPDDADPESPVPALDACGGRPQPCELAAVPLPTPCGVRDDDGDGIAQAHICTTTLIIHSDGEAFFHDPVPLYGPIGDVDDSDPDRPVPYSSLNLLDELLEESVEEVERIHDDVLERQDQLVRLVNQTGEAVEEQVWALYAELVQALDFAQGHLADTADRARAFVACTTTATETHAALVSNRVEAYAQNPNETNQAQFLDAGIEGGNAYLLNMRACNEPSKILAYGFEEMQYQCAASNHVLIEGARIVRDSQDPLYDLERIFQPGTDRVNQTLTACLDAPGRFLIELSKLLERSAESAQYALVSYADPEGSEFLDDLRQVLGVQDQESETAAELATRFSLPFTLALVIVLLAAALAMRRRR